MDRQLILTGDCRDILPMLLDESVQCCVTSPPYWGLRDYGTAQWEGGSPECDHRGPPQQSANSTLFGNGHGNGKPLSPALQAISVPYKEACLKCGARRIDSQLGLESTPEEYIANMIAVFREVKRVLRDDGTCWINLGDSYAAGKMGRDDNNPEDLARRALAYGTGTGNGCGPRESKQRSVPPGLKNKDLCMMPARLAMALQADGWYLRSEIVWHKPNPMPESVTDRPTKAHEMIYLLAKQERYFYDAEAIREPHVDFERGNNPIELRGHSGPSGGLISGTRVAMQGVDSNGAKRVYNPDGRNKRSVWTIPTQPYSEAHFATFPEEIPKLCILAGSKLGDTILDPFAGSGTTGKVAIELGRKAILIELNPAYIKLAERRTFVTPGFL